MAAIVVGGILAGVLIALAFWRFTNHRAVRALRRMLWAHVFELRLFGEDPLLALRSLFSIVKTNVLLVARAVPPLAAAAPAVAVVMILLSQFLARAPLRTGHAVLTVRLRRRVEPVTLAVPEGFEVDSPPVYATAENEISWRLRAMRSVKAACRISAGEEVVSKALDRRVRVQAWREWLMEPGEARLPAGPVERIWISQGLAAEWLGWFATVASVTAWLFHLLLHRL